MRTPYALLAGLLLFSFAGRGQGPAPATLVQWNFNNSTQSPNVGSGGLTLTGGVNFNSYAGQTGAVGASSDPNPAGFALETDTYAQPGVANKTAGIEIQLTTQGYKDIKLSFDLRHAARSSRRVVVQYSANAEPFQDYQSFDIGSGDTWANRTLNLSGTPAVSNITNLRFRIVSAFATAGNNTDYLPADPAGTYDPAASWRFDMITVVGTPLTPLNAPSNLVIASGSTLTNVTLNWTDNSSNEDNFVLERSPNGNEPWAIVSSTIPANATSFTESPPNGTPYFYRIKAINAGGSSAFTQTTNILPVTYLSFSARYVGSQVVVSWVTATERDNAYFDVERSADATIYSAIGRVTGKGQSNSRQQYSLTDETPLSGWNYYRLRQVDTDGTVSVSRPVAVLNEGALAGTSLRLFPNPASGVVTLQVESNAPVQAVRVSTTQGRWLTLPASSSALNASSLPAGQYIVEVQTQDGRTLRQRLVKE